MPESIQRLLDAIRDGDPAEIAARFQSLSSQHRSMICGLAGNGSIPELSQFCADAPTPPAEQSTEPPPPVENAGSGWVWIALGAAALLLWSR